MYTSKAIKSRRALFVMPVRLSPAGMAVPGPACHHHVIYMEWRVLLRPRESCSAMAGPIAAPQRPHSGPAGRQATSRGVAGRGGPTPASLVATLQTIVICCRLRGETRHHAGSNYGIIDCQRSIVTRYGACIHPRLAPPRPCASRPARPQREG